jgi:ABC-type Fe3+-hydroxamate transport system substrate-binding protein
VFSSPADPSRHARRAALCALALLTACGGAESPAARAPTRATDDFGDTLALAAAAPRRIVSLNPTTTELLYAIGAGPRLVGRTSYDMLPAQVRDVPDLGPGLRPNVEAVLGAHPDLVILYASDDNRDAARRLRAAGVRTASFRVDRIADFRRVTLALGAITGDTAAARVTVDTVFATLDRVRRATAGLPHPAVFWPLWESPLLTVGGGSYLNELLEIAGARNVYAALPQPSPSVTLEDLVRRDPDLVLASAATREHMRTQPRWRTLRAVRENHVVLFDSTIVNGPSARVGANAEGLARVLHPTLVPR